MELKGISDYLDTLHLSEGRILSVPIHISFPVWPRRLILTVHCPSKSKSFSMYLLHICLYYLCVAGGTSTPNVCFICEFVFDLDLCLLNNHIV